MPEREREREEGWVTHGIVVKSSSSVTENHLKGFEPISNML
jgi:hypothetical protein